MAASGSPIPWRCWITCCAEIRNGRSQQLQERLKDPQPQRISLRTPIRVFIVYTTALAAEDGRTLFFKDIYGQDAKLQALLDARSASLPTYTR